MVHLSRVGDSYICVDTANGNGEHPVKIHVRGNEESDQDSQGKYPGEETRLDSATDKSVENCIRLVEATSPTGEDGDQGNWWLSLGSFKQRGSE